MKCLRSFRTLFSLFPLFLSLCLSLLHIYYVKIKDLYCRAYICSGRGGGLLLLFYDLPLLFLSFCLIFFLSFYLSLPCINSALFSLDTASRTGVLGKGAVLFLRPFEARSGDPVRRELFRQQAAGHHSSSPWFAPTNVLQVAPPALPPCIQGSSGPIPSRLKKRRRRR